MIDETGKISDARHRSIVETSIVAVEEDQIKRTIARFERIW